MPRPGPHHSERFSSSDILVELEETRRILRAQFDSVGEMPPRPPTIRGRIGALLVSLVRRAMFWYIGQDREFHRQQLKLLDAMLAVLKNIVAVNQQNWMLLQTIQNHNGDAPVATDEIEKRLVSHDTELKRVLETSLRAEAKARTTLEALVQDQMNEIDALIKNLSSRHSTNHVRPDITRDNR